MYYSVIIPLYNRPDEIKELLDSLTRQTYKEFEVLVIEDGSKNEARSIVESFSDQLNLSYYFKENEGQGFARNYGFERAKGDWLLVFDSDAIVPPHYFEEVNRFLKLHPDVDAYGGADAADSSFTPIQKAISYSMTSLFTTGGIRGNKKHVGQFHPRSFNMGISRKVWEETGGYIITRMGEDIEFSIRIIEKGFKTVLIPNAFIYHKRRTSLHQFYKQLHFFGRARVNISRFYPNEIKLVHLFPAFFVLAWGMWLGAYFIFPFFFKLGIGTILLYYTLIFIDSTIRNKSLNIGMLSIATSFIQLFAYGIGFYTELFRKVMNNSEL